MSDGAVFIPPGNKRKKEGVPMKEKVIAGVVVVSLLAAFVILKKKGDI